MKTQVNEIHGDTTVLDTEVKTDSRSIFNVCFKLEDIHVNNSNYLQIADDDINTKSTRYVLMDYKEDFHFVESPQVHLKGKDIINTETHLRTVDSYTKEVSARHKRIQKGVKHFLDRTKLYSEVRYEVENKDIYAIRKDGINEIYEIKTYKPKKCIREALGQLLEYNHYPSKDSSDILYVVGEDMLDMEDKQYLSFLREKYNIPIWYRRYDLIQKKLFDKE